MSTEPITAPAGGVQPPSPSPTPEPTPNPTGTPAGAPVNTSPWYSDWLKADGAVNPAAYERLPDHLKHLAPSLKNAKTVDDVMVQFAHANLLAGKKGLAPLPADAPANVVAERNALIRSIQGVPDKPEGYGIAQPADLPDALWNGAYVGEAAKILHAHNAPPSAVKALVELSVAEGRKQMAEQANYEVAFFKQQEQRIAEQFQLDGIPVEKGMDLAARTAQRFGIDPEKNPIFKNADVVLMLQRVGVAIGEPNLVTGQVGGPEAIDNQARAEDIMHNKANPEYAIYWNGGHPQNRAVKAKVAAFMEAASRAQAKRR